MKLAVSILIAFATLTFAAGCGGDSYDKIGADMVTNVQAVRDALAKVTDVPSAQAAAEQIKAQMVAKKSIQQRLSTLGKPTKEIGDEMNTKIKAKMDQASKDIATELDRIAKLGPDVFTPIESAMRDVAVVKYQ